MADRTWECLDLMDSAICAGAGRLAPAARHAGASGTAAEGHTAPPRHLALPCPAACQCRRPALPSSSAALTMKRCSSERDASSCHVPSNSEGEHLQVAVEGAWVGRVCSSGALKP